MIHQDIEFHNTVEMTKREHIPGLQLQRIPLDIHHHLSERGRWNAQMMTGNEIRFVTDAQNIRLFVATLQGDAPMHVYQGEFLHSTHYITPGKTHCLHVNPHPRLKMVKPEILQGRRFSPNVWRFTSSGLFLLFQELETYGHDVRPPDESEIPNVRWLAYGSSISAGCGATSHHLSYVQQAAWRLGVDALNLSQGGACMCEPELADFFATRNDWDFATLEIGGNMLDVFTTEEFVERATYLLTTILNKNPGKPVVVVTPYPSMHHYSTTESVFTKRMKEYTAFLRDYVGSNKNPDLHLVEGFDILTDFCGHNIDLIHPFDTGMIQMGENLSSSLRAIPTINKLVNA